MTTETTRPAATPVIRCSLCRGSFPQLADWRVEGCERCARYAQTGGPAHFSSDGCRSKGPRRHEGCTGTNAHCTCDYCF